MVGCALTDPRASKSRTQRKFSARTRASQKRPNSLDVSILNENEDNSSSRVSGVASESPQNPIASLSRSIVIRAVETYRKKFPITNFLHYPSLISDISSNFDSVDPIFIASLLSLCVRFMSSDELEDEERYAEYARRHLAHRIMEAPSLLLAQSIVMISFYEWGTGRPYQAWMYSGVCYNPRNVAAILGTC